MSRDTLQFHKHLQMARRMATFLDTQFHIGKFRFGADPLVSLLPGVGSGITAILSLYLLWIAWELGLPKGLYVRMAWNIFLDFALGAVPLVGNVVDFFYKANIKNLELLEDYVGSSVTLEGHVV